MTPKKQVETDLLKSEAQNEVKTRAEKLKVSVDIIVPLNFSLSCYRRIKEMAPQTC